MAKIPGGYPEDTDLLQYNLIVILAHPKRMYNVALVELNLLSNRNNKKASKEDLEKLVKKRGRERFEELFENFKTIGERCIRRHLIERQRFEKDKERLFGNLEVENGTTSG